MNGAHFNLAIAEEKELILSGNGSHSVQWNCSTGERVTTVTLCF
jgi:hypothetical protein